MFKEENKISKYFEVKRGMQGLTEEFIYNNLGEINVISAVSEGFTYFGKINENIVKEKIIDKPSILIVRVGDAGKTNYVELEKYVITENVLYLEIKPEYEDKIDLEFMSFYLEPYLKKNSSGDSQGQRNISAEIINNITISIILDKGYQKKVMAKIKKIDSLRIKSLENINLIEDFFGKYLSFGENLEDYDKISLTTFVKHLSRNDALSEEGIYKRSDNLNNENNNNQIINVLSGSFSNIYGLVPISKDLHYLKDM